MLSLSTTDPFSSSPCVPLEANVLLIFGNVHPDGTHVGYLDPRELADRYVLDGQQETLEAAGRGARESGRRGGRLSARPLDRPEAPDTLNRC